MSTCSWDKVEVDGAESSLGEMAVKIANMKTTMEGKMAEMESKFEKKQHNTVVMERLEQIQKEQSKLESEMKHHNMTVMDKLEQIQNQQWYWFCGITVLVSMGGLVVYKSTYYSSGW